VCSYGVCAVVIHNITSNLAALAVDIDMLVPLETNARKGDVGAIMASYSKFGQLKPIVAVMNDDETCTVIAGNHQLEAAKQLGWQQIAVAIVDLDSEEALAFSLADNRISDLGDTDESILLDILSQNVSLDEDFYSSLGWDDFSIASIENAVYSADIARSPNDGWVAPTISMDRVPEQNNVPAYVADSKDEDPTIKLDPKEVATESIVTQGSTAVNASGSRNVTIQYTLVFENTSQQAEWYGIIQKLRASPVYEGATTTELLFDFIRQHLD